MDKKINTTRRYLKDIGDFKTFNQLIESSTLSDLDKQIVQMHYIEEKNFALIGDLLGYSESGIKKRHKRILSKLSQLL